jgi:hypothetical protein
MLALALALAVAGCEDPAPGEIGLNLTVNGQATAANVLVFNDKGKQIQMEHSDQYGVCYIHKLLPGTYTLKFSAVGDTMYPAVRTVKVVSDGSEFLKVDLNQAEDTGAPPAS